MIFSICEQQFDLITKVHERNNSAEFEKNSNATRSIVRSGDRIHRPIDIRVAFSNISGVVMGNQHNAWCGLISTLGAEIGNDIGKRDVVFRVGVVCHIPLGQLSMDEGAKGGASLRSRRTWAKFNLLRDGGIGVRAVKFQ